jgi:signal transduction histidine kinase
LKIVVLSLLLTLFLFIGCDKKKLKVDFEGKHDSLSVYFSKSENESLNKDVRLIYNQKALGILESNKSDIEYNNSLFRIANNLYKLESEPQLKVVLNDLLDKATKEKDSTNIAKSYNLLGNSYINSRQNDSAYIYLLKSEKLFLMLRDSTRLGKNFVDKAFVLLYENDFSGCEQSAVKALNYLKGSDEKQKEYDAYNLIGICSNENKNYQNALEYHKKALDLVDKYEYISKSKFHFKSSSLNNIGYVYQNLNRYKEAISNYKLALLDKNLLEESPYIYSTIIDNLAYSKFKLHEKNNLPDLFYESLKIRKKHNMSSGEILSKIHLSEYYATLDDTLNSQKNALAALEKAKQTGVSGDMLLSLKQLSLVQHKYAAKYSKEYIKISDSLQQEERKSKDKFARIAFETDEIIQEKDKLAEQNRSLLYFFIGTLFVGLLLFVIRTQRAKNRELLLKQQQQKVNEEIYNLMISQQATIEENRVKEKKRIAQELHDGVLGRLFGARLNLDSLNRFSDDESITSRFNYLAELKNIEQDIREISHDLNREKYVLINNFVAIVSNLLEEQTNSFEAGLTSSLDESIQWDKVSNVVKINLYRILQESLQNINKYATAKHISVEFKKENDQIVFKITDDGIGFDVNTKKRGIGLQNMQSRVNECEGTFDINSKKGKGTTTIVSVPIEKKSIEVS